MIGHDFPSCLFSYNRIGICGWLPLPKSNAVHVATACRSICSVTYLFPKSMYSVSKTQLGPQAWTVYTLDDLLLNHYIRHQNCTICADQVQIHCAETKDTFKAVARFHWYPVETLSGNASERAVSAVHPLNSSRIPGQNKQTSP